MRKHFPKPRLALALLGGVLLALVAGYVVLIAPARSESSRLGAEISSVQGQIDAVEATRHAGTGDAAPIRVADLFRLSRAMPDQPDVPDVLLQISEIATETGITFKSITPAQPVVLNGYEQLPIDLVFEGHFYDLADFLYRVRNLVGVHEGELNAVGRLFAVDSVDFDEGTDAFPQVEAKLRVDAYVFGDGTSGTTDSSATALGATP
jgi:type IV pilus assembly protein PilO